MPSTMDLERQLRERGPAYDREFASSADLERRIIARIATAPRVSRAASSLPRELALTALFVLFVAALLVGIGKLHILHQSVPAHPYPSPSIPSLPAKASCGPVIGPGNSAVPARMLSPRVGWGRGPVRTTDGGTHWRVVAPPSTPYRTSGGEDFFLDATHAWEVQTAGSPTACYDHVVTFRTTDGGSSWQPGPAIPVQVVAGRTDAISPSIDFIDAQIGWLLVEWGPNGMMGPAPTVGALYRTTDGGNHWKLVMPNGPPSLPSGCSLGGMAWASTTTGWLTISCSHAQAESALAMLASRDGGTTWELQRLPLASLVGHCSCLVDPPVFFDQRQGILHVWGQGRAVLLVTSDGGETWSPRALPGAVQGRSIVSFIDPLTGWAVEWSTKPATKNGVTGTALASPQLYRTEDGGKTWNLVPTNLFVGPANSGIEIVLFVDGNTGFASRVNQGATSGGTWNYGFDLLRTADGGRTWTLVDAQVGEFP